MSGFRKWLADASWAEGRSPAALIAAATFGILALELALIRWTSSQIRVFAYFNNLVLIAAFLGMGLGVALGRRHPGLVRLALPVLGVVALPLAFSERLNLVHLVFPDQSVVLWGGAQLTADAWLFTRNIALFVGLLAGITAVFLCAGAPLGHLFGRLPVLRAYTADLLGSLAGILVFALCAAFEATPPIWLAVGCVPLVWLARSLPSAAWAAAIVALGYYSVQGAVFSPYNRIALVHTSTLFEELEVNRDFHQYLHDFSAPRLADPALPVQQREFLAAVRDLYDLPFTINARRSSALVVGAGTGNDVQAAWRNGYRDITSVDIDGRIIAIGRERHPERPYAQPGVHAVVDDARSFFEKDRERKFDVVCYGLLDSHAMSSAMSTLRLDNYVYTEEGIRAAWRRVADDGHLSLAISCVAGRWFFERLYWTITRATGREPIAIASPLHATVTFLVPRDGAALALSEAAKRARHIPLAALEQTATTSDDWPFLYVRPGVFPWGYLTVLGVLLVAATLGVRRVFAFGRRGGDGFEWALFLMGAAFLLIETRGVTSMSLLFGSTWIVNVAIFGGVLATVLAGNLAVERWRLERTEPWFWALFATTALLCFFPIAALHGLPLGARALCAGLLTGLPIGCAGVIVPILLARSPQPAAALGANLIGAVLGGCLEYYSMLGGLRATALMALALYLCAYLALRKKQRDAMGVAVKSAPVHA